MALVEGVGGSGIGVAFSDRLASEVRGRWWEACKEVTIGMK
jgi:hypothetical protein